MAILRGPVRRGPAQAWHARATTLRGPRTADAVAKQWKCEYNRKYLRCDWEFRPGPSAILRGNWSGVIFWTAPVWVGWSGKKEIFQQFYFNKFYFI